uniref:Nucleoporin NUP53 n=1 Tax=Strongyloides papillosus TaxID=174720 RepID=A0A0N5B7A0_STREA
MSNNSLESSSNNEDTFYSSVISKQFIGRKSFSKTGTIEKNVVEKVHEQALKKKETFSYGNITSRINSYGNITSRINRFDNDKLYDIHSPSDTFSNERSKKSLDNVSLHKKNTFLLPRVRKSLIITEISYAFEMTPDGPVSFKEPISCVEKLTYLQSNDQKKNIFSQIKVHSLPLLSSLMVDNQMSLEEDSYDISLLSKDTSIPLDGTNSSEYKDKEISKNSHDRLQCLLKKSIQKSNIINLFEGDKGIKKTKYNGSSMDLLAKEARYSSFKINDILRELDVTSNDVMNNSTINKKPYFSPFSTTVSNIIKDGTNFLLTTNLPYGINKNCSFNSSYFQISPSHNSHLTPNYRKLNEKLIDIDKLIDIKPTAKIISQSIKRTANMVNDNYRDDDEYNNLKKIKYI